MALEALASGVPVIGSDAGGTRENLRQDLTGLIVPAGEPAAFATGVVRLAEDGGQRRAMREAARAFAVGRDWGRELDALEAAYAGLSATSAAVPAPSIWPTITSVT